MDATKFGLFVAEMRKENHMTQAELATKIKVTDKAVSRWERGLGFPDIHLLEPLAEALGVSVLELMKSEKNVETNIKCGDADLIVTDTIKAAEHQKQVERQQEKRMILITIGVVAISSIFALLFDHIGWRMDNILFTSVGVILPVTSIIAFFVLMTISLIRRVTGKSCKQTLIVALVFSGIVVTVFLAIFVLSLFAFPGQR
ncbi:MAG: helix-turn-helix domain-containing protein [Lachnospiraceae bacterium]|nr:helix-turn-helix domain-containing protein [Lachnospiraceae bacterium]